MEPTEAKGSLEYVRGVMRSAQTRAEDSWYILVVWGIGAGIAYLGSFAVVRSSLSERVSVLLWLASNVALTIACVIALRRDTKPLTKDDRRAMVLLSPFVVAFLVAHVFFRSEYDGPAFTSPLWTVFTPAGLGLLYVLYGSLVDRQAITLGALMLGSAAVAALLPLEARLLWMALAFSSSQVGLGLVLRRSKQRSLAHTHKADA
jgi:hypothetical protein